MDFILWVTGDNTINVFFSGVKNCEKSLYKGKKQCEVRIKGKIRGKELYMRDVEGLKQIIVGTERKDKF